MSDRNSILVVGGGVIGLSIAWELSSRGHQVTVMEKNRIGRKASWAGAGILAPANSQTATHPLDKLMGLGSDLHEAWHKELFEITNIDNGFRKCGGIYVAYTDGDKAALAGQKLNWSEYDIEFEEVALSAVEIRKHFGESKSWQVLSVPGESQICNPDHLRALYQACKFNEVEIIERCGDPVFHFDGERIESVFLNGRHIQIDQICFCAGAWSEELFSQFEVRVPVVPVRGQMLMYKLDQPLFDQIINVGSRYIVPRRDGHVLVGSTLEEVGFDESTTEEHVTELLSFAKKIVPALSFDRLAKKWAGLRPATNDGVPFMGQLAGKENVFVATGHFKCGLQMSPATAVIMADLMNGEETLMDVAAFHPSRLDFSNKMSFPDVPVSS